WRCARCIAYTTWVRTEGNAARAAPSAWPGIFRAATRVGRASAHHRGREAQKKASGNRGRLPMQNRGGDKPRLSTSAPALRIIMRRLREIMAEPADGQSRLDKIVRQIAGLMVAEVCSIYLKRQDGSLELFATEGLNPGAVHNTFMRRGEGLVGRCAE